MTIVAQIDRLIEVAVSLGYRVRYENLGGTGGGACQYAGKKVLFVDVSLSLIDQMESIRAALEQDPGANLSRLPGLAESR